MPDPILLDPTSGGILAIIILALGLMKKYWSTVLSIFGPSKGQKIPATVLKEAYDQKIKELERNQDMCLEDRKILNEAVRIIRTAGELMNQTLKSHEDSLRDGRKRFEKLETREESHIKELRDKITECAEKLAKIEGKLDNG